MQQDIAIRVSNVSKKYLIGKQKDDSLRGSLQSVFNRKETQGAEFMALNDVSFKIKKGDIVGIIGKNGAGKSTLLKILSQITKPTTGRIEINGRVASLLEVGTGFHPELTGRENIYLNGTILGMTRKEVSSKFDEIVDFSGVEKFIDTAVKHYSSGMYVRLAFAVAAHLEPEILIIDEVLAVGDAEFQKKCLGKMKDVASEGRTVIFVSHNIGAVSSLCNKGILLVDGQVSKTGTASEVAEVYLNKHTNLNFQKEWEINSQDGAIISHSIKLVNENLTECKIIKITSKIGIQIIYEVKSDGLIVKPNIHFKKANGEYVFVTMDHTADDMKTIGEYVSTVWIPNDFLNEGMYTIGIAYTTLEPLILHFQDYNAINIEVVDDLNSVTRCGYNGSFLGVVRPLLEWKTSKF